MRRCLLIGGQGFIGKHLAAELKSGGNTVYCTSRRRSGSYGGELSLEIADRQSISAVLKSVRPDAIINLAAARSGDDSQLLETNLKGVINLVAEVNEVCPMASVILMGSAAEYGNASFQHIPLTEESPCQPVGIYGITKLAATLAAQALGENLAQRITIVRPFNVVGPGSPTSHLVGALIQRIHCALAVGGDRVVPVGRVDTVRDFVSVNDVARAISLLLTSQNAAGIYNICSGEGVEVAKILSELQEITGMDWKWRIDPKLVRDSDPPVSVGSYAKLRDLTGYQPLISLREALLSAWKASAPVS